MLEFNLAIFVFNHYGSIKWIDKSALDKTHAFYEKHGGKTIMIAHRIIRPTSDELAGMLDAYAELGPQITLDAMANLLEEHLNLTPIFAHL